MDLKARIAAVKNAVPILTILEGYGYAVRANGGDREQQFPCDLHGDGKDGKPSARVYPETNSFFCFACGKARDVIELVREKERKSFVEALQMLERKFHIKYDPETETEDFKPKGEPQAPSNYESERSRIVSLLEGVTEDRLLSMEATFTLWEEVDRVHFLVSEKEMTERDAAIRLEGLRLKVMNKIGWVRDETSTW